MLLIQFLPQLIDRLRVMIDHDPHWDMVFLTWGIGFGATKYRKEQKTSFEWITINYDTIVLCCGNIGQFMAISDQPPISMKTPVNIGQKNEKIALYWQFLQEYHLSLNPKNR